MCFLRKSSSFFKIQSTASKVKHLRLTSLWRPRGSPSLTLQVSPRAREEGLLVNSFTWTLNEDSQRKARNPRNRRNPTEDPIKQQNATPNDSRSVGFLNLQNCISAFISREWVVPNGSRHQSLMDTSMMSVGKKFVAGSGEPNQRLKLTHGCLFASLTGSWRSLTRSLGCRMH